MTDTRMPEVDGLESQAWLNRDARPLAPIFVNALMDERKRGQASAPLRCALGKPSCAP